MTRIYTADFTHFGRIAPDCVHIVDSIGSKWTVCGARIESLWTPCLVTPPRADEATDNRCHWCRSLLSVREAT